MDAAPPCAQELSAAPGWDGGASAHNAAAALSLVFPLLPLDCRARAACVCRTRRAAAAHPEVWQELSCEGVAARIDDAALASLCARAGAALRTLRLDVDACKNVTDAGMLAALRYGGCTGVRLSLMLSAEHALQLASACPVLQYAPCSACCILGGGGGRYMITTMVWPCVATCRSRA